MAFHPIRLSLGDVIAFSKILFPAEVQRRSRFPAGGIDPGSVPLDTFFLKMH